MKKRSIDWKMIGLWIVVGIVGAIILGCIGATIAAWVLYGNTPVSEIPGWALWFMFGGGRG